MSHLVLSLVDNTVVEMLYKPVVIIKPKMDLLLSRLGYQDQ